MSLAVISAIIMTVLLIVMLVMGASISIAIGLSSAVAMLCMLPEMGIRDSLCSRIIICFRIFPF